MLLHLSIRDFAIVDRLELEFRPGFTALTGETGAGKSILIDALSMTLGDRTGSEQVRSGAERADVTAEFAIDSLPGIGDWLHEQALEGDPNRLLLRRVLDANAGLASLAQESGGAHREWQRLCRARVDHENNTAARNAEREQLIWQVEELSRVALEPGEWDAVQS